MESGYSVGEFVAYTLSDFVSLQMTVTVQKSAHWLQDLVLNVTLQVLNCLTMLCGSDPGLYSSTGGFASGWDC
jgi:hypothetical protein